MDNVGQAWANLAGANPAPRVCRRKNGDGTWTTYSVHGDSMPCPYGGMPTTATGGYVAMGSSRMGTMTRS